MLVGDPRQHIYSTNPGQKNKQYLGIKVVELLGMWEKRGLCSLEYMNGTHRCNRPICEFANALWPGMDAMIPLRNDTTEHDGIFLVGEDSVQKYIHRFRPQVLRHNKRKRTYGCEGLNFGLAKGLQFERVLIVPTEPIRKYLKSGLVSHVEKSKDRLHVAVTRARYSVAFVYDGASEIAATRWSAGDA